MSWDLSGMRVKGLYMESYPVEGVVRLSRVRYGGTVSHHVVLDSPVNLYGNLRDVVILEHKCVTQIMDDNK